MNDISPIVLLKLFLFGVKKKWAAKKMLLALNTFESFQLLTEEEDEKTEQKQQISQNSYVVRI